MDYKFNLKKLRQQKGLTQKDLAEKIGVRQATISDIENGKYETNISTLVKLSKILNVSLDEMIIYEIAHEEYTKELLNLAKKNPTSDNEE